MVTKIKQRSRFKMPSKERIAEMARADLESLQSGRIPGIENVANSEEEEDLWADAEESIDWPIHDPSFEHGKPMEAEGPAEKDGQAEDEHSQEELRDLGRVETKRLHGIVTRIKKGDNAGIAELKEVLDSHPEIWKTVGDFGNLAEVALVELVAQDDPLLQESLRRHILQLKTDLLTDDSSRLERLTVQRVVACWLHLQYADYAGVHADSGPSQTNAWAKRQAMAERRYQTALRSLKLVKQLEAKPNPPVSTPTSPAAEERNDSPPMNDSPPIEKGTAKDSTDSTSAGCREAEDGCKADSASSNHSNGHVRRHKIVPAANGKPVNRVFTKSPSREPALVAEE